MIIEREKIIKSYFESWVNKNCLILKEIFDTEAIYSECFGPEYHGLDNIERWVQDWNERGTVFSWDVRQFIHQENMTVVEWYFKCVYDKSIGEFNGVSLIEFNIDNFIVSIKEFQSKIPHYNPYI